MSDLRAAAQQALEALELMVVDVKTTPTAYEAQRQAIAALRAALAEPDYWQEEARRYAGNADYWRDKYKALAEPVQEPFCYHDGRNIVDKEFADHSDVFPLYIAPPRQWQGLTMQEVKDLAGEDDIFGAIIEFARAIEAKIKEKNQ